jgi:hypothetical protein
VKPGAESSNAVPAGGYRRGVRLFVALHLSALGTIYAVAVIAGGGLAGSPIPSLAAATASPAASVSVMPRLDRNAQPDPLPPTDLSAWTQRTEISSPWEPR